MDETRIAFPWEQLPAVVEHPIADTVSAMQRDMAYMVRFTCIVVHSNCPELQITVNTVRGQIIPRGECKFTDGSKFELQDIGMPQIGVPEMTVQDLLAMISDIAILTMGLELVP